MSAVVTFDGVGFAYGDGAPSLIDVDLSVAPGDVLLVKGSRGNQLERLVEALAPSTPGVKP